MRKAVHLLLSCGRASESVWSKSPINIIFFNPITDEFQESPCNSQPSEARAFNFAVNESCAQRQLPQRQQDLSSTQSRVGAGFLEKMALHQNAPQSGASKLWRATCRGSKAGSISTFGGGFQKGDCLADNSSHAPSLAAKQRPSLAGLCTETACTGDLRATMQPPEHFPAQGLPKICVDPHRLISNARGSVLSW